MGGRGREGEPIEWTGWACLWKRETEANPGLKSVTLAPSVRKHAEVIGPHAAKKSLSPEHIRPYRKPTPVGKEQSPQMNERPSVKELGKLTPYLWKKGGLST